MLDSVQRRCKSSLDFPDGRVGGIDPESAPVSESAPVPESAPVSYTAAAAPTGMGAARSAVPTGGPAITDS